VADNLNELAVGERDRSKKCNAGREASFSSFSSVSEGRAFTETGRIATDVGTTRVGKDERAGVPAQ
jgi:hypothetical protein